uniref:ParB-like N-terminal domain-containing protein n=1 Tax=uncultured bacterium Contig1770 TaxID=1393510 RepID=W0FHP6_9BACT|nr:hypothetical protein [uncultured bacterium Contig1770]
MQIRNVRLEAIVADENNPRQDFGDLDALAASFAGNGGQPWNPPIVVADGSIFRIVDGERRIRAMRSLGEGAPEEVACVVCEGMDERDAAVAMVATDDKRRLTDEEKSRGTQQMLLLGVDDDVIDAAAHLAPGSARRARRGRSVAGDAGDQMTFDRLFAIGELADEGEEEAMAAVLEADDGEWRHVLYDKKQEISWRKSREAILAELAKVGVEPVDEIPDGYTFEAVISEYVNPATVVPKLSLPEGSVCHASHGGLVTVYVPSAEPSPVDPEEQARIVAIEEGVQALKSVDDQLGDWLYAALLSGRVLPNVSEWALDAALGVESYRAPHFVERASEDEKALPVHHPYDHLGGLPLAIVIGRKPYLPNDSALRNVLRGERVASEWVRDTCEKWAMAYSACNLDGFEAPAGAVDALDKLLAFVDGEDGDE